MDNVLLDSTMQQADASVSRVGLPIWIPKYFPVAILLLITILIIKCTKNKEWKKLVLTFVFGIISLILSNIRMANSILASGETNISIFVGNYITDPILFVLFVAIPSIIILLIPSIIHIIYINKIKKDEVKKENV